MPPLLPKPLPDLSAVLHSLFFFQRKAELVHEIPCEASNGAVHSDGAPHHILDNKNPDFFRFLSKLLMSKQTRLLEISMVTVVEEFQQSVHIQVLYPDQPVSLRNVLGQQSVHQVVQNLHIL